MTASGLETILAVFAIMETTRRTESSFSLLYHIPTPKSNPSLYNCHTFGKPMVCLGAGDLRTKCEIWLVQQVRCNETLEKPHPEPLSSHALYHTNIS